MNKRCPQAAREAGTPAQSPLTQVKDGKGDA
jgi:hypothetical protein